MDFSSHSLFPPCFRGLENVGLCEIMKNAFISIPLARRNRPCTWTALPSVRPVRNTIRTDSKTRPSLGQRARCQVSPLLQTVFAHGDVLAGVRPGALQSD